MEFAAGDLEGYYVTIGALLGFVETTPVPRRANRRGVWNVAGG